MVNNEQHKDGFYELLKLEHDMQLPAHLEMSIMQEVSLVKKRNPIPIKISSIFIFGLLAFAYVIVAILSSFYYPTLPILSDLKMLLGLSILVQICYEAKELLPSMFEHFSPIRHHKALPNN